MENGGKIKMIFKQIMLYIKKNKNITLTKILNNLMIIGEMSNQM